MGTKANVNGWDHKHKIKEAAEMATSTKHCDFTFGHANKKNIVTGKDAQYHLSTRELQIRTTVRHQHTIKSAKNIFLNLMIQVMPRVQSNWDSHTHCCKMGQPPLWKTLWQFLTKGNLCFPYALLLRTYLRETKTYVPIQIPVSIFIAALSVIINLET